MQLLQFYSPSKPLPLSEDIVIYDGIAWFKSQKKRYRYHYGAERHALPLLGFTTVRQKDVDRHLMTMHDVSVRTIVEIPDEIIASLDRLGERQNKSRAALIREAVKQYLGEVINPSIEAAFGIWKNSAVDGVQYQADLRKEWDRR